MIPCYILATEDEDDRHFMGRLYENYNRLMYHEIYQIVQDSWLAEDVMHSTIVRLIDKVAELKVKPRDHLVNYIISACKNQARNSLRYNQLRSGYSLDECLDLPDLKRGKEGIEAQLILGEDLQRLPKVWNKLDERSQHILEGYYVLEKSAAQLADELDIKVDSVRMALTRARRKAFLLMQDEDC